MKSIQEIIKQASEKGGFHRQATLTRVAAPEGETRAEEDAVYEISFSSEDPYERWFGMEILGHKKTEIALEWISSGNAPLLKDHDRTKQIGVVDKAWLDAGRAKAYVRFGRNPLAREVKADVDAGVVRNISVGYTVDEMQLLKEEKDKPPVYRVTKWSPFEVSIVAVPADKTVGTNRAENQTESTQPKGKTMITEATTAPVVDIKVISERATNDARKAEVGRIREIEAMGTAHQATTLARQYIDEGKSADEFRSALLTEMAKGNMQRAPEHKPSKQERRDLKAFSFVKAISEFAEGGAGSLSGLEKEMHQEGIKERISLGSPAKGLVIPGMIAHRDLNQATEGADLTTNGVRGPVAGLLYNRLVLEQMGATILRDLAGPIILPKLTGGVTIATASNENDANSESTPTTGNLTLTPDRAGGLIEVSKTLLAQASVDVDALLRSDIGDAIAVHIQTAAITALLAASGIGDVAGGPNGLAPTWAHIVELESDVSIANGDIGMLHYLSNAKVRGKLKTTPKVASTDSVMIQNDATLNGYTPYYSNIVPSNLTKGSSSGVCSAIIFGFFPELFIALWGGIDLTIDPYTKAENALVRIIPNQLFDAGVRRVGGFSAMKDAITT